MPCHDDLLLPSASACHVRSLSSITTHRGNPCGGMHMDPRLHRALPAIKRVAMSAVLVGHNLCVHIAMDTIPQLQGLFALVALPPVRAELGDDAAMDGLGRRWPWGQYLVKGVAQPF